MLIHIISPYHGGSHRAWADGYRAHSAHEVRLFALPDRFWKWRMHGGAVTLARRWLTHLEQGRQPPDLLLFTDMCDVTTFLALTRRVSAEIPTALYMHENQLTYPLPADGRTGPMRRQKGERDLHYVFINVASMLAADRIYFNSRFHQRSFFKALPRYLKRFPEYNEMGSVTLLQKKSDVLAVGIDLQRFAAADSNAASGGPPLIIWNQRWEYDKNPQAFFAALYAVADAGIPFRLALCGQIYGKQPPVFAEAQQRLAAQLVHVGYAEDAVYGRLLREAAITISTARHEFFGISILEAIYNRTFPLLPRRLSYPELIPQRFHTHCFYDAAAELQKRLRWALQEPATVRTLATELSAVAAAYDWQLIASEYDRRLQNSAT